jgi:hypothetical protein
LKGPDGVKLIEGKRKTGFLGLIIDMSSVINLVEKYIIKEKCLIYLLTYKLSQDHIEMFFCAIRSKGGFNNNNPTATQFEAAYKRLLTHAEITTSASANCLPQDDTQILYVSSNSSKIIFENNDIDSITFNNDPFENEDDDEIIMDTSNNYIADVVDYLCGFVVKKLRKKKSCQICCAVLEDEESNSAFLRRKDRGGLVRPSKDVINVCRVAELVFRENNKFSGNVIEKLMLTSKRNLNIAKTSSGLSDHILEQDALNNHLLQLINLILKCYLTIRLHHHNMSTNEIKDRIRHRYSKLILFKNQ